jgi:two-component system response regulator PhoP
MRVLIVEDEKKLCQQLADSLTNNSYAVDTCSDGKEGLIQGLHYAYDLAIIDLGLPELSGIELIKQLRENNQRYPILILTARSNWQDKVDGLNAGADDYMVKPFHIEELLARMNALLRRNAGQAKPNMHFGPLTLDTAAKTASINNAVMTLTSYEYNTLEYLAHKSGQVISKIELTEHLYDQDFDRDSNVIEVFIGRLRKKMDPGNTLKPITTVRGQGYRFNLSTEG